MVEDRWVHAARRLTSIEFSFDPCNIYCDGPRGVGYPADARSVGDSHPSCCELERVTNSGNLKDDGQLQDLIKNMAAKDCKIDFSLTRPGLLLERYVTISGRFILFSICFVEPIHVMLTRKILANFVPGY